MKAEYTIAFLAELLELTGKLQDLVKDHCRLIVAEEQDGHLVETDEDEDIPF
jgi:hypothetical protein